MIFDKKAELLVCRETQPHVFSWEMVKTIPVKMEPQSKTNLFSKVGVGAKTMQFTLRKTAGITRSHAFRVDGRFYFLTDIQPDKIRLTIRSAAVEPVTCRQYSSGETVDENKCSVFGQPKLELEFPAILTEKYLGFTQQEPMAQTQTTFVLVTPKPIDLDVSDIVEIGEKRYTVQVCHTLDETKNEYEITRTEDV